MISLAFHGAAQTVTGSKYLLQAGRETALVDCGIFQGPKELRLRNWDSPAFNAHALKWVILTHSHTDHLGYLPRLYKYGFRGKVFCSAPTARLAEILLMDAAHIHEEDARYLNKTKATRHAPALPLFTTDEAKQTLKMFKSVPMGTPYELSKNIAFTLSPMGHILGACSVKVRLTDGADSKTVLFSGDIGRFDMPLIPDPSPPPASCDYLVVESTYGDRLHSDTDPWESLTALVKQMIASGGILLIPSFAVGRAQQLVHMLKRLEDDGTIPPIPIHVDSPMAIDATDIFCEFPDMHRVNLHKEGDARCRLHGDHIKYHRTRESSQSINKLRGPRVIISASGMLTGGRILHHLNQRLGHSENIIALAGYQAHGTRGRDLVNGKDTLRFHGREHPVRAQITALGGLSGHADYSEIMRWLEAMKTPPHTAFVTHGEPQPAETMAERLRTERGFNAIVPSLGDRIVL